MELNTYQALANRTINKDHSTKSLITDAALGLPGESGEVSDLVKKYLHQGHTLNVDKVIEEMGDVMWYLAEMAYALGTSLSVVGERNIAKLEARYPDGFSAERSRNRKE